MAAAQHLREARSALPITRRQLVGGLAAAAATAPLARLVAAASPPGGFLVVGDWGRDGARHQRDVAVQMGRAARELGSRFVLSVGDNFYEDGVRSVEDPQWRTSFEDVYTDPALQVPWYVTLGNHDYRGNPQAQVDYSANSARWNMPSRYYKLAGAEVGLPGVDLFAIDSSPLVHRHRAAVAAPISANVRREDVDLQLTWLDRELAASTAPVKLVFGHHTIRSGGSGHGETHELVAQLRPLLMRHGVQAYINGHDHDLQHIHRDGIDYVLCGAGSEVRPVRAVEGTRFCLARSGFGAVTPTGAGLALQFRDYTGALVYRALLARTA